MRPRRHSNISADLLGMPESVRTCVRIGEFLVAAAAPDLEELDELEAKLEAEFDRLKFVADTKQGLFDEFVESAEAMPDGWGYVALANIAVENRWLPFDSLLRGAHHVRINALFDMFGVDYAAHEIQSDYLNYVETLREASKSGWQKAAPLAAAFTGGAAFGWFTGGSGPAAKAADWLDDNIAPPTDLTFELATFAVGWDHLIEMEGIPNDHFEGVRVRCNERLRKAGANFGSNGAPAGEWNMWKFLVENLRGDDEARATDGPLEMPDFVGHALHSAEFQLEQFGVPYLSVDWAVDVNGASRSIWSSKNWRVVAQCPEPGEPLPPKSGVVLAAAKHGEKANKNKARDRARTLSESVPHSSFYIDD